MSAHLLTQRGRLWLDGAARTVKKTFDGLFTKKGRRRRHAEKAYRRSEESGDRVEQNSEDSFPASDPPGWTNTGVKHG
jgi:hypothetical protein